jgi:hypothetical protein
MGQARVTSLRRLKRRLEVLERRKAESQEVQKRAQRMVLDYLAEEDAKNATLAVLQGKRD